MRPDASCSRDARQRWRPHSRSSNGFVVAGGSVLGGDGWAAGARGGAGAPCCPRVRRDAALASAPAHAGRRLAGLRRRRGRRRIEDDRLGRQGDHARRRGVRPLFGGRGRARRSRGGLRGRLHPEDRGRRPHQRDRAGHEPDTAGLRRAPPCFVCPNALRLCEERSPSSPASGIETVLCGMSAVAGTELRAARGWPTRRPARPERSQRSGQLRDRRESIHPALLEALEDRGLHAGRHVGSLLADPGRGMGGDPEADLRQRVFRRTGDCR